VIERLFAEAIMAWGSAAPVRFKHDPDLWDFEIKMMGSDRCNGSGCVLAKSFFPDGGRHGLEIYPKMFTLPRSEQVETLIHEVGHVFGLRHFFANLKETDFPSEIFGRHEQFSIMNYGEFSRLTSADKEDLTRLYQLVWSGSLPEINGTKVKLMRPYSSFASDTSGSWGEAPAALQPAKPTRPGRGRRRVSYPDRG